MKITSPQFDEDEIKLLRQCLDSGWVTQGALTRQFEELFGNRHSVRYALATTSCTAALHLATMALGLGPGDEVIVPAFTWITSAHSVEYTGARAVFVDIEPETFNICPEKLEMAITPNSKAVVVVHLFGLSAKMDEILNIAQRHNLFVIEDAACAVGSHYDGKPVGGIGHIGCFSFHPRKVITTGEGGMVTTNSEDYAKAINSLRNHGAAGMPKYSQRPYTMATFDKIGYNLRLSDIQAAVGVAQMSKLDRLLNERKLLAERYNQILADIDEIALPYVPNKCAHTYQAYVIRILSGGMSERNKIMDYLESLNIETRPGTHAVHRLGYYAKKYNIKPEQYPVAALCEDTTITLPLFPGMTQEQQLYVAEGIKKTLLL
ncbi:DegT/DnrJ/EryC1/StrS family aminotransferase [Candidatus Magnetominusculus xianensis]|uniref:Glutamine--scyllo-inositol aminotransferase n=1 Tax=Candidatus Magnetominusculus xianensis TaxID=1748249 RepID=A0ABR5SLA7_9BACT|nr:DegT/DnrJ/EryC1/StrS family aminotransferase [Candidatus Magnetominusculus xianensis]KWT91551.1 glutamine--scyllo-inositol aminotransferase [Candidatus Magnetominusculus xianensis]MBF0404337.1 DegT/DnrJ/EryC1/StrS family aminotransferase [Nitrospirota bacterium]